HFVHLVECYKDRILRYRASAEKDMDRDDGDYVEYYDEKILQQLSSDDRMTPVWRALTRVPDDVALHFLFETLVARRVIDRPWERVTSKIGRRIESAREMRAVAKKLLQLIQRAYDHRFVPEWAVVEGAFDREVFLLREVDEWLVRFDRYLEGHLLTDVEL